MPVPRETAPALAVATLDGDLWTLATRAPDAFTMLVFYRGLHCPICARYLGELDGMADDFAARGVEVIAISTDTEERARASHEKWGLRTITLGYGLDFVQAREWGLFLSSARNDKEPAIFNEPGLFLVRPDGTLYFAQVQSAPFTRPPLDQLLKAIDFVSENGYPARGELRAA